METLVFNNSKGGVAKTTSCAVIGQLLAAAGYKVLICDLDPQKNISAMFGSTSEDAKKNVLMENLTEKEMRELICDDSVTEFSNLEVLPGSRNLSEIVYDLRNKCVSDPDAIMTFKNNLERAGEYDYILIDTSPFKSYLTLAAVCASNKVYVPIEADNFSYEGLKDILNTIESVNDEHNLEVELGGVFITKADVRTTRYKQIKEGYEEMLGDKFIPTIIKKAEAVAQSSTAFEPLLKWDKKCSVVDSYLDLIKDQDLIDGKHYRILRKFLGE